MKKNLLLYGVFLGALSLSFCSGNAKNKEMTDNGMSMESANEVIRYCYIDKTEGTDMLPIVPQPALYEG